MAVSLAAKEYETTSTSRTVNKPTGTADGDLLVAIVSTDSNPNFWAPPTGFELVASGTQWGGPTLWVFAKTAGASEPSSYTFGASRTDEECRITLFRVTGADGIEPFVRVSTAYGSTLTFKDIETSIDNCALIAASTIDGGSNLTAASAPTGWTEERSLEGTTMDQWVMSDSDSGTAGTQTAGNVSIDAADQWVTVMLAIYPTGETPADPSDHVVTQTMGPQTSSTTGAETATPDYFVTADDVLVTVIAHGDTAATTCTWDTDWTERAANVNSDAQYYVGTKTCSGSETQRSEVHTLSVARAWQTTSVLMRGVTYGGVSADNSGADGTIEHLTVTPTVANSPVLLVHAKNGNTDIGSPTWPAGYDGILGGPGALSSRALAGIAFDLEPASATGTQTITVSGTEPWVANTLYFTPSVTLEQEGYRFYADGTESGSTALANQDTSITRNAETTTHLRIAIASAGDPASKTFKLQYEYNSDGIWKDVIT